MLNAALRSTGRPEKTRDEVRCLVGDGVRRLCAGALGSGAPEEEVEQLLSAFQAHYALHMNDTTCPYPGITALLQDLRRAGIKLAVVSNKYTAAVERVCRQHFGDLFDVMIGEGPGRAKKPAPDALLEAIRQLGETNETCVMVGDGAQDIQAGKNAHCRTIGVTWGFRSRELLVESGADAVVDTAQELKALILNEGGGEALC